MFFFWCHYLKYSLGERQAEQTCEWVSEDVYIPLVIQVPFVSSSWQPRSFQLAAVSTSTFSSELVSSVFVWEEWDSSLLEVHLHPLYKFQFQFQSENNLFTYPLYLSLSIFPSILSYHLCGGGGGNKRVWNCACIHIYTHWPLKHSLLCGGMYTGLDTIDCIYAYWNWNKCMVIDHGNPYTHTPILCDRGGEELSILF